VPAVKAVAVIAVAELRVGAVAMAGLLAVVV
jgi:hypothetical protein